MTCCETPNLFAKCDGDDAVAKVAIRQRNNELPQPERDRLVESMIGRAEAEGVRHAEYIGRLDMIDDFQSEAKLATVVASKTWHPGEVSQFGTYATAVIRRSLLAYTRNAIEPATGMEDWSGVPGRTDCDDEPATENGREPNDYQQSLLAKLDEPARSIVRCVVFGCDKPDDVAERFGIELKDVKLHIRNASRTLGKVVDFDDGDSLFDACEFEGD
jgi:DNA-directed RNA polymerase specialized sigma24 family protein